MTCGDLRPAKQCSDTQKQLVQIDGLSHIVIDADAIALLHGENVVLRRHEQDRDLRIEVADRFRKLISVDLQHHDVRDDEIEHRFIHGIVGVVSIQAPGRFIAVQI